MENEDLAMTDQLTPSKRISEKQVLRTPRGGILYNPFQQDYISRLEVTTLTPGLFKTPQKRTFDGELPNSESLFSPDIRGDHFPTEIDENPVYQVKLQQELDDAVCYKFCL